MTTRHSIQRNASWRFGIQLYLLAGLMCGTACDHKATAEDSRVHSSDSQTRVEDTMMIKIEREGWIRNKRIYEKGNISFSARPIKGGNNYRGLHVGSPEHPYNGDPPLIVRFQSGVEVNLAEITEPQLREQATSSFSKGMEWDESTKQIRVGHWQFWIRDGQILFFTVTYSDETHLGKWTGRTAAIGNPKDGILYEFPLKQQEVISVFGKPDRIREFLAE